MRKLVIFDLDGVLLESKYLTDLLEQEYGVPSDESFKVLLEKVLKPAKNEPTYPKWKDLLEKWKVKMTEEEFLRFWREGEEAKVNQEVLEILKDLKQKGIKVVLLTDNIPERMIWLKEKFPFFDLFDKTYCSFEIGHMKSDPRAVPLVLKDFGVSPEEVLHIDDSESVIEKSKALGLSVYHFGSVDELRKLLES